MTEQQTQVAVTTGAASGIGRGLAERAAALDYALVLADRDEAGQERLAEQLRATGAAVLTQTTDVADPLRDEGEAFAERLRNPGVSVKLQRATGMIYGFISFAPLVEGSAAVLAQACDDLRHALA